MVNIDVTQYINAPREKVWEILSDHEGYTAFKGVSMAKLLKPGGKEKNGLGAVREVKVFGVTFIEDIVGFDPPSCLEYHVSKCSIPMNHKLGRVEFTPRGEGTEVHWVSQTETVQPIIGGLLGKIGGTVMQYIISQALLNVKNRLEG